jgi:hypothetical protein
MKIRMKTGKTFIWGARTRERQTEEREKFCHFFIFCFQALREKKAQKFPLSPDEDEANYENCESFTGINTKYLTITDADQ